MRATCVRRPSCARSAPWAAFAAKPSSRRGCIVLPSICVATGSVVQVPEDVDVLELAAAREPVEPIEDVLERHDLTRAVERAMAKLPEEQRTAIILKDYHGLTFQEIADLSGCPLSTVKTRLYQGLAVLRRELGKRE